MKAPRAAALLTVLWMISLSLTPLLSSFGPSEALVVSMFGDGTGSSTIDFGPGGGTNSSVIIPIPNNTRVLSATFNVSGLPHTDGGTDYLESVEVDVASDDVIDLAWGRTGQGMMGRQYGFTNGSTNITYKFDGPEGNSSAAIMLPSDAVIESASINITAENVTSVNNNYYDGSTQEHFGVNSAAAGDVNGDGYPDFIVASSGGSVYQAKVFLFLGGTNPSKTPAAVFLAEGEYDNFGWWLDGAGDLNNDGYDDIIVGAPDSDNGSYNRAGAAYIYFGGQAIDTVPDIIVRGVGDYDNMGEAVAGIGDINADGFDDVAIGIPGNDTTGANAGAVMVMFGGNPMKNQTGMSLFGFESGSYFGYSVGAAGDVNKDNHPDLIVGAYDDSTASADWGAVYIYHGGPGFDNVSDVNFRPPGGYYYGYFVNGIGDMNGDGYDDIIVNDNACYFLVYYGGNPMDTASDLSLSSGTNQCYFGNIADGLGDLNKDGYDDIIIGDYSYDTNPGDIDENGRALVYFGGATPDSVPELVFTGENYWDKMGISVAGPGDVNGDGFRDILIGESGLDYAGQDAGREILCLYSQGLLNPKITLESTGTLLWNKTGIFGGVVNNIDIKGALNGVLPVIPVSMKDQYGTKYTNVTLNVSNGNKGVFKIDSVDIRYKINISLPDLSVVLNGIVVASTPDLDGTFRIPVKVSSPTSGKLRVSDLRLVLDEAPVASIGSLNLSFLEGTKNATLYDLRDVFSDDRTPVENLTFQLTGQTNKSYVRVTIREDRYLSVDAVTGSLDVNWTGSVAFSVRAYDLRGLVSSLLPIRIDVQNVQDPPVFITSVPTTAMEDQSYTYQATAVDGDVGTVLEYFLDESPLTMTIDKGTGFVRWTPRKEDTGTVHVTLRVTDGVFNVTQEAYIGVSQRLTPGNRLPIVTSVPEKTATIGIVYSYRIEATDPDRDPLVFTLDYGPANMTIERANGKVRWLPALGDEGLAYVSINISDGKDRIYDRFAIDVQPGSPNFPPELIGSPPTEAYIGLPFSFQFQASDRNPSDVLTFDLTAAPTGMTVSQTGLVSWVPKDFQNGTQTFTLKLSDGKQDVIMTYSITVWLNHAPKFDSIPETRGTVGKDYNYKVLLSDEDNGDTLTISLVSKPDGMLFDPSTATVSWTPNNDQVGLNTVRISVTDGKETVYQNFSIDVVGGGGSTAVGTDKGMGNTLPLIILVLVLAVIVMAGAIYASRSRAGPAVGRGGAAGAGRMGETSDFVIEDVFLIYRDGRLMSHHTRRLKPEADAEIITSMLTAIQDFVRQSIPTEGMEQRAVHEIIFGNDKILLQHGKNVYIAAVVGGESVGDFPERMKASIEEIESIYGHMLADWDGDISRLKGAKLLMRELLKEGAQLGSPVEEKAVKSKGKDGKALKDVGKKGKEPQKKGTQSEYKSGKEDGGARKGKSKR